MPTVFTSRKSADEHVVIIDGNGPFAAGHGLDSFDALVTTCLHNGDLAFIFNMEKIDYVDSEGFGKLVCYFEWLRSAGGSFKLLKPNERARSLFDICGVRDLLEIFDDESKAIASFHASAAAPA